VGPLGGTAACYTTAVGALGRRRAGIAAIVLVAVASVVVAVRAAPGPANLPPITADRLTASAAAALARDPTVAGEVSVHVDLGVPSLGDIGPFASGPLSLLGDHVVRLWRSPFGARVALVEGTSERDLYLGRTGAWAWDFGTLTATRLTPAGVRTGLFPLDLLVRPSDFEGLFRGLEPTTRVFVDEAVRVAGRAAYRLVLEPRTPETLVGRVEIDVDAQHRLPLAVRVFARGSSSAALSVAFTSVSFDDIDPHMFDFSPPPGVTVRRIPPESDPLVVIAGAIGRITSADLIPGITSGPDSVRSYGHDWASVVAVHMSSPVQETAWGYLARFLPLSAPLFSARLVDRPDGQWFLAGSVPQSTLQRIQAGLP
jgi:hypothetical protein